jgi:hypothetical protein
MMDAGCYCAHALRYFAGMQPQVINAAAQGVFSGMIDKGMKASKRKQAIPGGTDAHWGRPCHNQRPWPCPASVAPICRQASPTPPPLGLWGG